MFKVEAACASLVPGDFFFIPLNLTLLCPHANKTKTMVVWFSFKLLYFLVCGTSFLTNCLKKYKLLFGEEKIETYSSCTTTPRGPVDDTVNWFPSSYQHLTYYLFNKASNSHSPSPLFDCFPGHLLRTAETLKCWTSTAAPRSQTAPVSASASFAPNSNS